MLEPEAEGEEAYERVSLSAVGRKRDSRAGAIWGCAHVPHRGAAGQMAAPLIPSFLVVVGGYDHRCE